MKIENVLHLPSGRIFLLRTDDGYLIESTEMRDVSVGGKEHQEVRQSNDPHVIWKHLVPFSEKWLLTVSTQKGCTHKCRFCDVAALPFKGNISQYEIEKQVTEILKSTPYVKKCQKVKIGFARMGEPAWNLNAVLSTIRRLPDIAESLSREFRWLPCFNTILPKKAPCLNQVIELKEKDYKGFLHLQISCNSTDEEMRLELFGGASVLSLEDVINEVSKHKITNRTVTLNFIVMKGVEVSIDKLKKMGLNKDKFMVKLIPLNDTLNAREHDLETVANYSNYEDLLELKNEFEKADVPVVVDVIAKCEEAGLCCGQLAQIFQS